MTDCRLCECQCAGCRDRRHNLTHTKQRDVRTVGCFCGAPEESDASLFRRLNQWAIGNPGVNVAAPDED